jgi:glutathione S-transferase
MKLYIGNKNYSSWSLRPWLLLKGLGIAFDEVQLRFDDFGPGSAFHAALDRIGAGVRKVPILVEDEGFAVWETLAIAEYIADRHPEHAVWPRDARTRARARSYCAEMHAGFGSLRNLCPMNIEAYFPEIGARLIENEAGLRKDLARIDQIWSEALAQSGGPFLFGDFGAVDAYFAPVVMRATRFALPLSPAAASYAKTIEQMPAMADWVAQALLEQDYVKDDEPYRSHR